MKKRNEDHEKRIHSIAQSSGLIVRYGFFDEVEMDYDYSTIGWKWKEDGQSYGNYVVIRTDDLLDNPEKVVSELEKKYKDQINLHKSQRKVMERE